MSPPAPIPSRVETHADIPRKLIRLYELDANGSYSLTPAGRTLAQYRDAIIKDPSQEPVSYKHPLAKADWELLVGLAEPGPERAHFLRCAAAKRIRIA